jgi:hypothetical protein
VILTFILEPDGTLGEMKARGNNKPAPKYHPQIMQLLLSNIVKGIGGMGYLPDMNFSVFDLDDQYLRILDSKKPNLIVNQLDVNPYEILHVSDWIKQKYGNIVTTKVPALRSLLSEPSIDNWISAIDKEPNLILYAPENYPDHQNELLNYLVYKNHPASLLKVRKFYRRDFNFLSDLLNQSGNYLAAILPTIPRYHELAIIAVNQNYHVLEYVPAEIQMKYPEIPLTAVKQYGQAVLYVPAEVQMKYPEISLTAVENNGVALDHVSKEVQMKYPEISLAAVKNYGRALMFVPEKVMMAHQNICWTAVQQYGRSLKYVPKEIIMDNPEICLDAVEQDDRALAYVPDELKQQVKDELGL